MYIDILYMPYNAKYVSRQKCTSMHRQLLNSGPTAPVVTRTPPRLVLVPALQPPPLAQFNSAKVHHSHTLDPDGGWLEQNFLWVLPIGLVVFLVAFALIMAF